jgi:hypothetical protein
MKGNRDVAQIDRPVDCLYFAATVIRKNWKKEQDYKR